MSSSSLKRRVFPSSKPPDGGYPPPFRLLVGGTQLHGSWYLSAIVRLQGFSSRSLATPRHRRSPKMVTSSSMVGKTGQAAASTPPSASRIFVIQAKMEDEASRGGPPPRGSAAPFFPLRPGVKGVLEPHGDFLQPCQDMWGARGPGSPSPCLNGWFSSSVGGSPSAVTPPPKLLLKLLRCLGQGWWPSRLERAAASRPSFFSYSAGLPLRRGVVRTCGGGNRSSVGSGIPNASEFVHCGCRGLNVYVILARSRVFSSFSSTKSRLLII
jgi:hypothetical protein